MRKKGRHDLPFVLFPLGHAMPNYDFKALSSYDFENCVRDLLQKNLGIRLESFKAGRDQGIDLRYSMGKSGSLIVQCKHYADSGFQALYRHLNTCELPKVKRLLPERYVLATSVGLTPHNKDELKGLLTPYCTSSADIYGKEDLNNVYGQGEDPEEDCREGSFTPE